MCKHHCEKCEESTHYRPLCNVDRFETAGVTLDIQWNLIITATYGPNISGCYIEVAALQRWKCFKSRHLGLGLGGCNNEVTA